MTAPASFRSRLAAFAAARLDRRGYLGLHLTVGFTLTVLATWLFAELTEAVVSAGTITRFDLDVNAWIRSWATPTEYAAFGVITELGAPTSLTVIGIAGAIMQYARGRRVVLIGWAGALLGGAALDAALKLLVHRPRPPHAMDYLVRKSWSYPSGHSMMATVCFGMVAYLLCTQRFVHGPARFLVILAAAVVIVLVGTSRVLLGVHYMSDVIAGFVAGVVWLTACVSGLETVRRRDQR